MDEFAPREINYLRLSITDRCNLRCTYCTYWQEWQKLPGGEILRYEELLRLARVAAGVGVRKIRVTGGEPLVRRGVVDLLKSLHQVPGIEEVCLTTNGVLLSDLAAALHATGLRHLNVSLDTLRRERYLAITGKDNLPEVLAGLDRAATLGFHPLKINCVMMRGLNEDEISDLALLARDHPLQVRFIELMPSVSTAWWERHFLSMAEVRRRLATFGPLEPVRPVATDGPARIFRLPGFRGEVGFISPMSAHHCESCNRLRLTAAGQLRPCLLESLEMDLKGPMRQGVSDYSLMELFRNAIALKNGFKVYPKCHKPSVHSMASIGG